MIGWWAVTGGAATDRQTLITAGGMPSGIGTGMAHTPRTPRASRSTSAGTSDAAAYCGSPGLGGQVPRGVGSLEPRRLDPAPAAPANSPPSKP